MKANQKTIIIVVVILIVAGGAYFGYNRWRQQQIANRILSGLYGVNTGGVMGGGSVADLLGGDMAKLIAEQEAKDKAEEAKEAAKTPADKFNATKEATAIGGVSPTMTNEIEPAINAIFEKSKIVSYGGGYMIGQTGSFGATVMVPRAVTADDLGKLAQTFQNKGFTVISSSVESGSGEVSLMKNEEASISFSYSESGEDQKIEILYWQLSAQ